MIFIYLFFYKVLFLNKMAGNINLNRAIQLKKKKKTLSNKTQKNLFFFFLNTATLWK